MGMGLREGGWCGGGGDVMGNKMGNVGGVGRTGVMWG